MQNIIYGTDADYSKADWFALQVRVAIIHAMAEAGVSNRELGRCIGCSHVTVANLKSGKSPICMTKLSLIAQALDMEPGDFVLSSRKTI